MRGREPVVVDGIVSEEKLAELLALQAEYPELDYKETIDLSTTRGVVELAKDVGAMRVRGATSWAVSTARQLRSQRKTSRRKAKNGERPGRCSASDSPFGHGCCS